MTENQIKLIVLDVDGVLTDGKLWIGSNGDEYKSFHVKDGLGMNLARFHGIPIALITGRKSKAVQIRARELNIDFIYEGITNKVEILHEITTRLDVDFHEVFYMGDDINDLPIIKAVGYTAAPRDAVKIIQEEVDFVSEYNGGHGAVREAIEHLLRKQTDYPVLIEEYLTKSAAIIQ